MKKDGAQCLRMPIKVTPYQHQRNAFDFVCRLFGLIDENDEDKPNEGGDAQCIPLK